MKIPADWDKPSPGNEALCKKFSYGVFEDKGKLVYRLFTPDTGSKVPLVIYLHGADAFGDDNEVQLSIHDIGTMFAREDWQGEHPCYILAPQCRAGSHWAGPGNGDRVCALIMEIISRHDNIDEDRIYIYGYSAGGIGALEIIKDNPGIFAAGLPICAATGRRKLEALKDIPLWLFHAADDEIVKASYFNGFLGDDYLGSKDIYEELKDEAPFLHYTEYPRGFMRDNYGINPHCSWVPVSEDKDAKEWLFKQGL